MKQNEKAINKTIHDANFKEFSILKYSGNNKTPSLFFHKTCEKTFKRAWNNVSEGINKGRLNCPNCKRTTQRMDEQKINSILSGTGYSIVEYAGNNKIESTFKHDECGYTFKRKWNVMNRSLKDNSIRCEGCGSRSKPYYSVDKFNESIIHSNFEMIGDFEGSHIHTRFKHKTCGFEWEVTPSNVRKSVRLEIDSCPNCYDGESMLAKFTKQKAAEMFSEIKTEWYIIKNPKTNAPLYFDIYIEDVNTVIEVHGQQHYDGKLYMMNERDFTELKFRDEYKKNWCLKNGIRYIEIDIRKHNKESVTNLLAELKTFNDYRNHAEKAEESRVRYKQMVLEMGSI